MIAADTAIESTVREQVALASQIIAPAWPIGTFIATNSLIGLHDQPFGSALDRASALLGSRGYLPDGAFRRLYRQGRIDDADLAHALAACDPCPDLPPTITLGGRKIARTALLRLCLIEGPGDRGAGSDRSPALLPAARRAAPAPALAEAAAAALAGDMASVGVTRTLGDLCALLGATDIVAIVNDRVSTWCAAFLDDGQAAWTMPGREQGFYACWHALALHDLSGPLLGIRDHAARLRALPADPARALSSLLDRLAIPDERRVGYLARHLAQLPGWAARIRWHEERADPASRRRTPIDLAAFLAVRLFYEATLLERVARDDWDADCTFPALRARFGVAPIEYYARRLRAQSPSPGAIPRSADGWRAQARALHGAAPEDARALACWLADLCDPLGVPASSVDHMPDRSLRPLARLHAAFGPDRQGAVWLEAFEHHYRRSLLRRLAAHAAPAPTEPPRAQVVCCIDARSEGLRRHLEGLGPYETFGFAGFFGVPIRYRPFDSASESLRCPVLIAPRRLVTETPLPGTARAVRRSVAARRAQRRARDLAHGVKEGALAPYTFVEAVGWLYALPAIGRTLAPRATARAASWLARRIAPPVPTAPAIDAPPAHGDDPDRPGMSLLEQVAAVEGALRGMGLTGDFARLVLLCGHGSETTNNPFGAALDCGACGGNRGGVSARVAAAIANRPAVRAALRERGLAVPSTTLFLAGEHNTTVDTVEIFDVPAVPESHRGEVALLARDLARAGALLAAERCRTLPDAPASVAATRHVRARGADWAQLRPEWGLAGNAAFICAPRARTRALDLGCRTFLHSYDPDRDQDGAILEGILTAPLVVAHWINAQYYLSTVDNARFGSGNKLLHTVVGRSGVLEGGRGDLRIGLPWQSVMDGDAPYHEPMRLLAIVEAPLPRIDAVIARHALLRRLFDHRWVTLVAWDGEGAAFRRHRGAGTWLPALSTDPPIAAHPAADVAVAAECHP